MSIASTSTPVRRIADHLFNLSILQKKRLAWVDYLRGIAIFLVVYRHVFIGIERSGIHMPKILETANLIFFSFRIPLFFILSGIFISGSLAKKTPGKLIGIKFDNLFYPYLIWSVIQITVQIFLTRFTNSDRGLIDYSYILYQPRSLDQFWYLPALFNVSVIYIIVKTKFKPVPLVQITIGLVLYFCSKYCSGISMISDWMDYYIYFALGDAIAVFFFQERVQRFLKNGYSLLLAIPFFVAAQVYYLNNNVNQAELLVIALVGCVSMFILAFRLQSWNVLGIIRVAGYHSLYIYVMHVLASAPVRMILSKLFGITDPGILLAAGILAGVVIPVMFYNLLVKDNILWFLFSYRRPAKSAGPNQVVPVTAPVNQLS